MRKKCEWIHESGGERGGRPVKGRELYLQVDLRQRDGANAIQNTVTKRWLKGGEVGWEENQQRQKDTKKRTTSTHITH